jgi:hypothetical protein
MFPLAAAASWTSLSPSFSGTLATSSAFLREPQPGMYFLMLLDKDCCELYESILVEESYPSDVGGSAFYLPPDPLFRVA